MIDRAGRTMLKVAAVCGGAAVGFVLFQAPMRHFETRSALWLLHHLGGHAAIGIASTVVLIIPRHHAAFDVLITPACSSLASLVAICALAPFTPRQPLARRVLAVAVAVGLIAIGNVLRITGAIAAGLVAGRTSLILLHDWVGSMFTFVYTMGGYILMLSILLPKVAGPFITAHERTSV
jgi:exosortase/archaeosortase family protein